MKKILITSLLLISAMFVMGVECSTANLQEVKLCSDPNEDTVCESDESSFAADTEEIYVTGELHNAPEDTTITITWRFLEGNLSDEPQDLDVIELVSEDSSTGFHSSLTGPAAGWPAGEYEVVLDLGTDNSDPITKKFTIEPRDDTGEVISDLLMCEDLGGANKCPDDTQTTFSPDTPVIYISGFVAELPGDSTVDIIWRYTGGEAGGEQVIDTVTLEGIETPNPFSSNLSATASGWPRGDYEVVIELDGEVVATESFSVQ